MIIMLVKAFVVIKKNQLRIQSLLKTILTSNLIKTNKKIAFKLLNAIKKFIDKIITKIVKRYLLFTFINFTRFENFFLIKNVLLHVKILRT